MIHFLKMLVRHCACDLCSYEWNSLSKSDPPICPSCRSREWNGTKKIGRPSMPRDTSRKSLPKPKRVRSL
jgi:hypothetical protein